LSDRDLGYVGWVLGHVALGQPHPLLGLLELEGATEDEVARFFIAAGEGRREKVREAYSLSLKSRGYALGPPAEDRP
jgi:hypothetical protein